MNWRIFTILSIIICSICGCGSGEGMKSQALEPEEVLEAFNRAVAAGDFDAACGLCDTIAMKEYLDSYIETWKDLQKQDSSALVIASSLLSEATFEIEKVEKKSESREIYYSLQTDVHKKSRKATLKNEEGEWKVKAITDVISEE